MILGMDVTDQTTGEVIARKGDVVTPEVDEQLGAIWFSNLLAKLGYVSSYGPVYITWSRDHSFILINTWTGEAKSFRV